MKFKSGSFILLSLGFLFNTQLHAQNVAINSSGTTGNAAAILDLSDASNSTLGLLTTNVTLTNSTLASPITSPPEGLIVYNSSASTSNGLFGPGFYYWSGTQWLYISNSGTPSSGTVTSVGLTGPGGVFGITNTNGNPITSNGSFGITTTGTSGGIPYFSSASVLSSSALLTHYGIIYGGGAGGTPVSTAALTNGQVLIGSTGAAPVPATITPATNSGISITNGAGSITIGTNGVLNTITVITHGTTTYSPSTGTQAIQVELIGGGGGGGACSGPSSSNSAGGGGGSGGYVRFMVANPVGPYTVAVGAGGGGAVAATNTNGTAGGATTFTVGATTYSAGGGQGGIYSSAGTVGTGGAGGTNSGGTPPVTISGTQGGAGLQTGGTAASLAISGAGGSSVLGGGAPGNEIVATGGSGGNNAVTNTGSGGSGGVALANNTKEAGGNGANGLIIITEYK